jgi:phosphoglycolate phosphatase-like HAD superfamily hydrolase
MNPSGLALRRFSAKQFEAHWERIFQGLHPGMRLLLFDIDGTLIRSHSAGREAMAASLRELFGTSGPAESYRMSGKTDPRIITDLLTAAGIDPVEIAARLPEVYALMAEKARGIFPGKGIKPCPGVMELLSALRWRHDAVLGLLTGNAQVTAPLKLAAAGIDPAQFAIGAYGSDAMDRNQLPAVAMNRANQLTNLGFAGYNTVIIGDTPADILCARAGGATAVAVASGWHSGSTLSDYRPDYLLENLSDTNRVLSILLPNESSVPGAV